MGSSGGSWEKSMSLSFPVSRGHVPPPKKRATLLLSCPAGKGSPLLRREILWTHQPIQVLAPFPDSTSSLNFACRAPLAGQVTLSRVLGLGQGCLGDGATYNPNLLSSCEY